MSVHFPGFFHFSDYPTIFGVGTRMHAVPQKVAEKPLQTARRRLRKRDRVYTRNDDAGDVAHMDRGVSGNPFTF